MKRNGLLMNGKQTCSMTDTPLVSVLISCYNHADYVETCVSSILRQTYPNIELIAIDDGSRDGSPEILERLSKEHGFYFERQENHDLPYTLNKGASLAKGKYICPMNSDDIMFLDKTEKQVRFLEANPDVACCGGNGLVIDADGQVKPDRHNLAPYHEVTFEELFTRTGPGFVGPTGMISLEAFNAVGGYDTQIPVNDLYMWLKLAHSGYRVVGLNDVLVYYRQHGANMQKNVAKMLGGIRQIYALYGDHPKAEAVFSTYLNSAFLNAAKAGDRAFALQLLREIRPRYYSWKIPRGLVRLLLP